MIRFKSIYLLFLALFLSSCFTGFFPETEEVIDGVVRAHATKVCFRNTGPTNVHKVTVYYDNDRTDKICDVLPGATSALSDIFPSSLYSFFVTFYLTISGIEIPVAPSPGDGGLLQHPIKRDVENTVPIVSIFTLISDLDKILVNDGYYITIRNVTGPVFSFLAGSQLYNVVGGEEGDEYITAGNTGIYKLTATSPYNPRVQVSTVSYTLPITTFERGKVYSFAFNGSSVAYLGVKDISLRSTMP